MVIVRGQQAFTGQADGETVPIPTGGYILENMVIVLWFLVITEHMENGASIRGTVGADSDRNTAAGKTFSNNISLRGNLLLTVLLGCRCIQQNIHRQVSYGEWNIPEKDFFMMEFFGLPDTVRTEDPVFAFFFCAAGITLQHIADAVCKPGNAEHVAGQIYLVIVNIFLLLQKCGRAESACTAVGGGRMPEFSTGDMEMTVSVSAAA